MKNLLFSVLVMFGSWAVAQTTAPYDFIQTTGEGEIKAQPDYVLMNVTVYSRAASAQVAQKDNAREMARIDKLLKNDFKIDSKDIQTLSFQVAPQYEYQKDRQVYKGMNVTHTLNVKYRKVHEVGSLLDKLITDQSKEGFGVRVEDINFGTDQMKSYQVQALELAMSEAKARAQVLAKAGSRQLLGVRKVSDVRGGAGPIEPMRGMNKMTFASMAEDASTNLAPGQITVRAQVVVEFDIK